jgi:hypothetical protein
LIYGQKQSALCFVFDQSFFFVGLEFSLEGGEQTWWFRKTRKDHIQEKEMALPLAFDELKRKMYNQEKLQEIETLLRCLFTKTTPLSGQTPDFPGENAIGRIESILRTIHVYSKIMTCFDEQVIQRAIDILEVESEGKIFAIQHSNGK